MNTPSQIEVRVGTEADLPDICRLMAGFRDSLGKDSPGEAELERSVRRILPDERAEFLIAAPPGGEPAGVAQVRYRWSVWTGSEDCWLEDLYVVPAHRRAGLAGALVAEVLSRARARGCGRVELDVDEDNDPALALYRGLGFSDRPKGPSRSLLMGTSLDPVV